MLCNQCCIECFESLWTNAIQCENGGINKMWLFAGICVFILLKHEIQHKKDKSFPKVEFTCDFLSYIVWKGVKWTGNSLLLNLEYKEHLQLD